jgi:hypothetical protein
LKERRRGTNLGVRDRKWGGANGRWRKRRRNKRRRRKEEGGERKKEESKKENGEEQEDEGKERGFLLDFPNTESCGIN